MRGKSKIQMFLLLLFFPARSLWSLLTAKSWATVVATPGYRALPQLSMSLSVEVASKRKSFKNGLCSQQSVQALNAHCCWAAKSFLLIKSVLLVIYFAKQPCLKECEQCGKRWQNCECKSICISDVSVTYSTKSLLKYHIQAFWHGFNDWDFDDMLQMTQRPMGRRKDWKDDSKVHIKGYWWSHPGPLGPTQWIAGCSSIRWLSNLPPLLRSSQGSEVAHSIFGVDFELCSQPSGPPCRKKKIGKYRSAT